LLADQFYMITPAKYRGLLENFVYCKQTNTFTLKEFCRGNQLDFILFSDDNKLAILFEIYCKKLRDGQKLQSTTRPTQPAINSGDRSDEGHAKQQRRRRLKHIQNQGNIFLYNYYFEHFSYDSSIIRKYQVPTSSIDHPCSTSETSR
jgi:hypothetical protein